MNFKVLEIKVIVLKIFSLGDFKLISIFIMWLYFFRLRFLIFDLWVMNLIILVNVLIDIRNMYFFFVVNLEKIILYD